MADPAVKGDCTAWDLPESWSSVHPEGPRPFVTREIARRPDGVLVEFTSRRLRKGTGPRPFGAAAAAGARAARRRTVWWAPRRLGWWIAALFLAGSACFALGSAPGLSSLAPTAVIGGVFFVGSLFFTTAAYLQFVESVSAGARRTRLIGWQPGRLDWWAASVQLIGTLWFNLNTWNALQQDLTVRQENLRVWTPDMIGSVCFLVASWLAVQEVCHTRWCVRHRDVGWSISLVNLLGSVFFMLAAVAAFVRPATGDMVAASIANGGTFLGALCFFRGARLLLVELADP